MAEEQAARYTVGAVATRLGIPVATLRSWNQRYAIGPPRDRPGVHRRYSEADIATLRRMIELVRAGAAPEGAARQALAEAPDSAADRIALLGAVERLEPDVALTIILARLARDGVVATWNELCRPAFATIVAGQTDGRGLIEVEHLLSWSVIAGLHRMFPPVRRPGFQPPILLACTAGEDHVLALEVLRAALAERGIVALLLGAAVPDAALTDAIAHHDRSCVLMLWSQMPATAAPETIRAVRQVTDRVLVAGPGWSAVRLPPEVSYVRTLEDALGILRDLGQGAG
ncbi:MerR family transcriptional regulator [Nocardia beijingensis]|uniref:MerR family transcriptional regulator n=1 Tax=Nocardia beijingensis TaxID=95162 RepID=UPI001893DD6B|nr:MerR family transcriptional regulator [Nocardia beijingensis]MBF6465664.1 MerR family transcriptional regulator [Nocardia beijingensis]